MMKEAAVQKVIDLLCELEEVTPDDVRYALSAYDAAKTDKGNEIPHIVRLEMKARNQGETTNG